MLRKLGISPLPLTGWGGLHHQPLLFSELLPLLLFCGFSLPPLVMVQLSLHDHMSQLNITKRIRTYRHACTHARSGSHSPERPDGHTALGKIPHPAPD